MDLGSFYLDIIKDRQYTTQRDSVARRSAQTALVSDRRSAWCAGSRPSSVSPRRRSGDILPGEREESVFLETWFDCQQCFSLANPNPMVRDDLLGHASCWCAKPSARSWKSCAWPVAIGSSLDAEVDLYVDGALLEQLQRLSDELRFVLITSYAKAQAGAGASGRSGGARRRPDAGYCRQGVVRCRNACAAGTTAKTSAYDADHPGPVRALCGECDW